MKARIKATGEIVDETAMVSTLGNDFYLRELEPISEDMEVIDYWTSLEHTYAGMFLQAQISYGEQEGLNTEEMVEDAMIYAHALVEKLKEKEERK